MMVRYAVTFEFYSRPPLTHRGTVLSGLVGPHVWRGRNTEQKAQRPAHWSSMVVLLRVPDDTDHPTGKSAGVRDEPGRQTEPRSLAGVGAVAAGVGGLIYDLLAKQKRWQGRRG
jgi:hypothetical protein